MLVVASLCAAAARAIAAAPPSTAAEPRTYDLLIYDSSGTQLLGHAHYTLEQRGERLMISGRNHFLDGQYDIERDILSNPAPLGPQRLLSYEHDFFDAHGASTIVARANTMTGKATCYWSDKGRPSVSALTMEFPSDTYAGASVLVPIADALRQGVASQLEFHVFDCASNPRILTLRVDLERSSWPNRPLDGQLVKAEARPVFGWLDLLLKPFIPVVRLWFEPERNYSFVGGMLARYYRGPELLLVSTAPPVSAGVAPPPQRGAPAANPPS
jgi:hypothetical protein